MTTYLSKRGQPATRWRIDKDAPMQRNSKRAQISCSYCLRTRWAQKLIVYLTSDGANFLCKDGCR